MPKQSLKISFFNKKWPDFLSLIVACVVFFSFILLQLSPPSNCMLDPSILNFGPCILNFLSIMPLINCIQVPLTFITPYSWFYMLLVIFPSFSLSLLQLVILAYKSYNYIIVNWNPLLSSIIGLFWISNKCVIANLSIVTQWSKTSYIIWLTTYILPQPLISVLWATNYCFEFS